MSPAHWRTKFKWNISRKLMNRLVSKYRKVFRFRQCAIYGPAHQLTHWLCWIIIIIDMIVFLLTVLISLYIIIKWGYFFLSDCRRSADVSDEFLNRVEGRRREIAQLSGTLFPRLALPTAHQSPEHFFDQPTPRRSVQARRHWIPGELSLRLRRPPESSWRSHAQTLRTSHHSYWKVHLPPVHFYSLSCHLRRLWSRNTGSYYIIQLFFFQKNFFFFNVSLIHLFSWNNTRGSWIIIEAPNQPFWNELFWQNNPVIHSFRRIGTPILSNNL